jgi:hypothetical protein
MDWVDIALLTLISCSLAAGVCVVFSRPTGPRITRYAQLYLRANPQASEGDLREALRQRFLGGSPPIGPEPSRIAEGVRDRWFPLDRDAISRRIEAAIQIVLAPDASQQARTEPSAPPDRPRD